MWTYVSKNLNSHIIVRLYNLQSLYSFPSYNIDDEGFQISDTSVKIHLIYGRPKLYSQQFYGTSYSK